MKRLGSSWPLVKLPSIFILAWICYASPSIYIAAVVAALCGIYAWVVTNNIKVIRDMKARG